MFHYYATGLTPAMKATGCRPVQAKVGTHSFGFTGRSSLGSTRAGSQEISNSFKARRIEVMKRFARG
jgi:hypothetical protein